MSNTRRTRGRSTSLPLVKALLQAFRQRLCRPPRMASFRALPQGATHSAAPAPTGWLSCRHQRATLAAPPRHGAAHARCPSRWVAARSGGATQQSSTPAGVLSLANVRVADAMKSPPVTVSPDTSVFDVLEVSGRHFKGVWTCDRGGRIADSWPPSGNPPCAFMPPAASHAAHLRRPGGGRRRQGAGHDQVCGFTARGSGGVSIVVVHVALNNL